MRLFPLTPITVVSLVAASACGERGTEEQPAERAGEATAEAPRAEIVHPADGDTVTGPNVHVQLAAHGVRVAAALGERVEGEGHHHLFVDKDVTPPGDTIPKQVDGIIHLGTGAEEFEVKDLGPGAHRIIAVLAWGDHVPMEGVAADTVRIYVKAPGA